MGQKILHVTAGIDPAFGGVSQAVQTMIKGLSNHDIINEVVCLDDPNADLLKASFPIYALGPGRGPWCYSRKLLPWLNRYVHKYDVIIVHGLWLYHAYATKIAIRNAKSKDGKEQIRSKNFKMFIMPHGMLDPYFQKAAGRKLKSIRNFIYWKVFENRVVNDADGLLFTSNEELRLAHQSFRPFVPKKEMVVGLGVDTPPLFVPTMSNAFLNVCPEVFGHSYFLFLSRIHQKKGIDMLIRAYKQIMRNKFYDANEIPKLVIAGPGLESDYGKEVKKIINEDEELSDFVFFTGMLTGDAKWGAFYGSEVFVLPSHQENFGIAIVEALACGKPVLISNKINIWKDIEANGAGIVAEDSTLGTTELLERWLVSSKKEKKDMGQKAYELYKNNFATEQAIRHLADVLN